VEPEDGRNWLQRFCARAWKPFLVVSGLGLIGSIVTFGVAYAMTPDFEDMEAQAEASQQATVIRFANDDEVGTFGEMNRVPVTFDQIPDSVINGVLAAEQRAYYQEALISPSGTARAVLSLGADGGGSGIAQQMARNYYDGLSQERSYTRKIKEILVTLKVGQSLSKDEILEQYLNTIYFGRGAYGVQAASQAYFGKNVEDLDDAEGALLGGIIQQPSTFENAHPDDPIWPELESRFSYVADEGLPELNAVDANRGLPANEASQLEMPEVQPREADDSHAGYNGYIIEAAKRELQNRYELTDEEINRGGLTVTTSLDENLMEAAEQAVLDNKPEGTPDETNFGLAAVDPATGEIRAFYGGTNVFEDTDNSLLQWGQAGSSQKPTVLAAGLQQGIGLRSTFDGDSPQEFEGVEEPIQNNADRSWGEVDLVESMAHSVNTTFVQLAIEVGPENVRDMMGAAGLPEDSLESADLGPNIALGTYSVRAVDQASVFGTFANGGVHMPQHLVTEVTNAQGDTLEPNDAEELERGAEAFSPDIARDATYAMQQVIEGGGAESARLEGGRPAAGKTGTSNDAVSAWFGGFTPQLSAAVGIHRSDNEPVQIPGMQDLYGSTVPVDIWRDFMNTALEDEEILDFEDPVYVGSEQSFLPEPEEPEETEEPTEEPSEDVPTELPTDWPTIDPECPPWDRECDDDGGGDDDNGGGDDDDDGPGLPEPPGWGNDDDGHRTNRES
jgi:membrane peptidoglycan carboxypeptidase